VIAVVIIVLAVLVVAAIVWARVSASRSENRSVETYEHALGVLGEVSKRTESTGFRILPHEQTGRAHVARRIDPTHPQPAPAPESEPRNLAAQPPQAPRRLPPAGEPKLRFSKPARPPASGVEQDESQQADPAPAHVGTAADGANRESTRTRVPASGGGRARRTTYNSVAERRRQVMTRRAATAGAAAAAIVAVIVASIYLSSNGGGHHGALGSTSTTTTTTGRNSGGGRTTTTTSTTTTQPSTLNPTSVSPVTFAVPSGGYTLSFQASGGACWVGIEHSSAGPWLFSQTLNAGQSATFKGSGALIVTLGAPPYVSLSVDGLTAELPSGYKQAYSLDLAPTST